VMLFTRGTRGDVQPFLALARGLVLHHGCEVTLVTELNFKQFVKNARQGLPEGSLRFRPSGGDTMLKVSSDLNRWVMNRGQHLDAIQALILSRSEVEFFPSEGCFYHWAWEEQPDFIVFGFTITHIAMLVSEALSIPIVGFILQPSREVEPRADPASVMDELSGPMRELITGREFSAVLQQIMDRLPNGLQLDKLRTSRGLPPCPMDINSTCPQMDELVAQGVPLVVPFSAAILSEQGREEASKNGLSLTDFIFLRLGTDRLDDEVQGFVKTARSERRQVVAMTFSSMPVGERVMLEVAVDICQHCMPPVGDPRDRHKPAVIALVGGQGFDPAPVELVEAADRLAEDRRLLVLRRPVPFGALFPAVDAVVLHGGLGVTSEALQAGVPVITSGILLMDQRYWAARVAELGAGSEGVPIESLLDRPSREEDSRIVTLAQRALDKREPQAGEPLPWSRRARELQHLLQEGHEGDADGVVRNADAVFQAGVERPVRVRQAYADRQGLVLCCGRQCLCCARTLRACAHWLVCRQVPSLLMVQVRLARWCVLRARRCCRRRAETQGDHRVSWDSSRDRHSLSTSLAASAIEMEGVARRTIG